MADPIGEVGPERYPGLIADFFYDNSVIGNQAAGAKYDFTNLKLETDEVCEIEYMEIFSPQVGGVAEDLRQVIPILDGSAIEEYVSLSGRYDSNMAPPRINQLAGPAPLQTQRHIFRFGEPCIEDPFRNTTLKAKKQVGVRTLAGAGGAITQDYRIRYYGYIYHEDAEIREVFGDTVYGREALLQDLNRGLQLRVTKDAVDAERDNWDSFVGGVKQRKPQIMPLIRFAYNALATTANTVYDFEYEAARVASKEENMYFDFDESEALCIFGFGVRSVANLQRMGVKIGDHEYPKGAGDQDLFRVDNVNNPLHFGEGFPLFPAGFPIYVPIPMLPLKYLVHNEKGRIIVYDNGTAIAANAIIAALQGIKVDLP